LVSLYQATSLVQAPSMSIPLVNGVNPLQTTLLELGIVSGRVALLLRSAEIQPLFLRFVLEYHSVFTPTPCVMFATGRAGHPRTPHAYKVNYKDMSPVSVIHFQDHSSALVPMHSTFHVHNVIHFKTIVIALAPMHLTFHVHNVQLYCAATAGCLGREPWSKTPLLLMTSKCICMH
jgi:hypothetical protein